MKKVIIDFDNTMGVPGCDVDDGLALLYLLGNPELCRVEAACTAYGNSTIDIVHDNTLRLFELWELDIPVYRGGEGPGDMESEASRFLSQAAAGSPGELSILATGSTTNLLGALRADPAFLDNTAEVVLMGGVTESLVINGRYMSELNFSCDPDATLAVLQAASEGAKVSVATAQHCLPSFFDRKMMEDGFGANSWLVNTINYWFGDMDERYRSTGFVAWDLVAAAMLIKPWLFEGETRDVSLNRQLISAGFLESTTHDAPQARIETPVISNPAALVEDALESWQRGLDLLGI